MWIDEVKKRLDIQDQFEEDNEPTPAFEKDPGASLFYTIHNGVERPIDLRGLYHNCGCFFIGGGPSFAEVNKEVLQKAGILTWCVNNSVKSFRTNLWTSVDDPPRFLESIWRDPKIMKFCGMGKANKCIWDHDKWAYSETKVQDCPNVIHFRRNNKFNAATFLTEDTVNWGNHKNYGGGRSVMVATLRLMYELGIRRVYLLGVDFKMTGSYTYHFGEQRAGGAVKGNNSSYMKMLSYFTQLAPYFKQAGYEVYQCTRGSELTIFPYMDLERAIEREIKEIPNPATERASGMYVPGR